MNEASGAEVAGSHPLSRVWIVQLGSGSYGGVSIYASCHPNATVRKKGGGMRVARGVQTFGGKPFVQERIVELSTGRRSLVAAAARQQHDRLAIRRRPSAQHLLECPVRSRSLKDIRP